MACPCGNSTPNVEPAPNSCYGVTVQDLQTYLGYFMCVKNGNLYSAADLTVDTVEERIGLLNTMIADKEANAGSCNYQGYVSAISDEVTQIILNTDCG